MSTLTQNASRNASRVSFWGRAPKAIPLSSPDSSASTPMDEVTTATGMMLRAPSDDPNVIPFPAPADRIRPDRFSVD